MAWKEEVDLTDLHARIARLEGRVAELEQGYRAMRSPLAVARAPAPTVIPSALAAAALPAQAPQIPSSTHAHTPDTQLPVGQHLSSLAAAASARRAAPNTAEPTAAQPQRAALPDPRRTTITPAEPRTLPPQPREQLPRLAATIRNRWYGEPTTGTVMESNDSARPALEQRIGGRVFAIAGALVVIIGMGLFMKLAVDQGWLGALPPAARCVMGAAFGFLLLLLGEFLRRRINAWAATGLFATGIGAIYLSIYSAHAFFSLLSPATAFVLLALAAAVGVAAAVRANLAAVAVISLTGGYLAPVLVRSANPSPFVLPLYLLVLLAGALALAAWKRGPFRLASGTAWFGTLILGTLWVLANGANHGEVALAFLALTWGLMHMGHALALRTRALDEPAYDDSRPLPRPQLSPIGALAVSASVSASSWAVGLGWLVLNRTGLLPEWLAPAAAIGPCLMLGQSLAGGLRVLKDTPRTDSESFGAVLLVQAGGLLIATLALAISGSAAVVVWLSLGVAAMVAGLWVGSRGLRVYGLILLAIGTARVVTYDLFVAGLATPIAARWGVQFSWWMVLMALAAVAWLAAAEVSRRAREARAPELAARAHNAIAPHRYWALVGVLLATAAPLHRGTEPAPLVGIWIGLALVLSLGVSRFVRAALPDMALIPAAAALGAWLMAFVAPTSIRFNPAVPAFGLHAGTYVAAALLAACWWLARRSSMGVRVVAVWGIALASLYASTLEVVHLAEAVMHEPHAALAAVSIWWGVVGVAAVAIGFVRRNPALRYAALALMALTAGKVLVIDMADAPAVARIASLVVTGLLMLGVSVIYAKVARTLGSSELADT